MLLFSACSKISPDREEQIRQFINDELKYYPEARLADLYKNYFQDAFGPGHLIPDTSVAGAYLDSELKNAVWGDTLLWQALGVNHDYYRINLSLVKNGKLPRNMLLEGMAESEPLARKPNIEDWKNEWDEVMLVIKKMKLDLPDMQADEKRINEIFEKGNIVMHHSDHYAEKYNPHYRVVHRSVFERWKGVYF
ncbi:MAG: hypothetical protein JW798_15630 [Prolixibacteraceae bacterium]|nr:hypothetical protein [Prolixibacteraceae bacterium]